MAEAAKEPPRPLVDPELSSIDVVVASTMPMLDAVRAKLGLTCGHSMPPGCEPSGYRLANAALRQKMKSGYGSMGGRQTRILATQLVDAEAKQRWNLSHDSPRYCQFMRMRQFWFKLLQMQAVELKHRLTDTELAEAATHLVAGWIQDMQQAYGTLLPAEDGVSPNHQADVQPQQLPDPISSAEAPTASDHVNEPTLAARNDDLISDAETASTDQQTANEPCPSGSANAGEYSFTVVPPLGGEHSVSSSHWQPRSPLSDCWCEPCLAWQTGKQPPKSCEPTRKRKQYLTLPVRAYKYALYRF